MDYFEQSLSFSFPWVGSLDFAAGHSGLAGLSVLFGKSKQASEGSFSFEFSVLESKLYPRFLEPLLGFLIHPLFLLQAVVPLDIPFLFALKLKHT